MPQGGQYAPASSAAPTQRPVGVWERMAQLNEDIWQRIGDCITDRMTIQLLTRSRRSK